MHGIFHILGRQAVRRWGLLELPKGLGRGKSSYEMLEITTVKH
jgi:hypothetical protein